MKNTNKALCGVLLGVGSMGAWALEAGDTLVRIGASTAIPHENSHADFAGGEDLALENEGAAIFSMSRMISSQWAIGAQVTTPFNHQMVTHSGGNALFGEFEVIYPGASLQYHQEFDNFKPYAGVGAAYAMFLDVDANSTSLPGSSLDIDDELVTTFELGCDYKLDESTYVNLSAIYIHTPDLAVEIQGNVNAEADVDINPVLWNFSFAHKF